MAQWKILVYHTSSQVFALFALFDDLKNALFARCELFALFEVFSLFVILEKNVFLVRNVRCAIIRDRKKVFDFFNHVPSGG